MTRKASEVELRDFRVQTLFTGKNHSEVAKIIGFSRESVYASIRRFKIRCEVEKGYNDRFEEWKKTNA